MPPLRVRYTTVEFGEIDIHLRTLRNLNEYADAEGEAEAVGISSAVWPRFGVVWESGQVLAALMADAPIEGLRILEVGCGIGLASLVLNQRGADITATDRHPEAGHFLAYNAELNGGPALPFIRSDWEETTDTLGRFDLIIGSDLLYDPNQAPLLAQFIEAHANPRCQVVLIDPGRGQANRMARLLVEHGFEHEKTRAVDSDSPFMHDDTGVRIQVHAFTRRP